MGDFWSGTTKYDENEGQRRREAAAAEKRKEDALQTRSQSYADPSQIGFNLTGTRGERERALSGLELAKTGYGQDIFQTGQDIQRVKGIQRGRTDQSGADPVSEAIRASKAGAMAGAQRNLASSGVKGGVAAAAMDAVGRQRDADIAASLYGQQRQSLMDERSLASNMLAGTTSLMQGERAVGTSQSMPGAPKASGMFDSVICTELHRQGIMPSDLYMKDAIYGANLKMRDPYVFIGYHFLAKPLVKKMQTSKLLTNILKYPAMKWAKHIAGEEISLIGSFLQVVGEPFCSLLGKAIVKFSGVKYAV